MLKDAGAEILDFTCLEMRLGPRCLVQNLQPGMLEQLIYPPNQNDDINITILGNILYDLFWTK